MQLGKMAGFQQDVGPRSTLSIKIGLLVSLLLGAMAILFAIGKLGLGSFEGAEWQLDILVLTVVAVPVIVILRMIVEQVQTELVHYTEFVANLGTEGYPHLRVEQDSRALRKFGNALNKVHQRLQQRLSVPDSINANHKIFSGLVDASPNIVLTMDETGEVQYLNARGRQVADAIGLSGEDISVILPMTPSELIQRCVGNNEVLREQEVRFRDRKFIWTLSPLQVHGEKMLQAHGTISSRQRKLEYQNPVSSLDRPQTRLYSIDKHPDYQRYRGSILVIDSDNFMQSLMSRYLQKDGFRVITANDGEAGLEAAEQHKPDLIALDIMMPGKNGWMVLSALKENPELAEIPVIIVSSVGNRRFVHAMGADDYVPKPVDWKTLSETVNRLSRDCRKTGSLQ